VSALHRATALVSAAPLEAGLGALRARRGQAGDRPALKKNIVARRIVQMGDAQWVVKNPDTTKYYSFDEGEWGLITLFDGTRTLAEIHEIYQAQFPGETVESSLVAEYEEMLRGMDLLEQNVAEKNLQELARIKDSRRRTAEQKAEGFDIFLIPFKVFDPNRFLERTQKYVRWIWRPPAVLASLVVIAVATGVIVQHFATIWAGTLELYAFLRKPFWDAVQFFVILTFIGLIHELAHGYVCKFYGGEVHDVGVALLYFMPAFYCDTTDALLFPNKWHRLWVMLAGMYIEAIICSFSVGLWVASYPDTLLHELAYKLMLFTGISTIFFNINPLRKIDGYYALSSVLEIPQLREDSFEYLAALFKKHVLRLNVEVPVLSRRKRRIFLIYGPLALGFMVVIMWFIGNLFYNFYAKYFPNVAIVLLALTLLRLFRKQVRTVLQGIRLVYLDKKEWLMSRRIRSSLLASAGVLFLLVAIPWTPWTVSSDATLMPWTRARLEAPEGGIVASVRAREGDAVRAGDVVAVLESPSVESGMAGAAAQGEGLRKRASRSREAADAPGLFQAERRGAASEALLAREEARARRLSVASPIAGRVLTHRMEDLTGRFLQTGGLVAEVGDVATLRAEIPVTERLLSYLHIGSPVSLQLRARPARPLRGSIVQIGSAAHTMPATADGSAGAVLRPSERPERFIAVVRFDNADGSGLPGMSGQAKISLGRRSILWRTWRVLSHWLQTVIWW
jgi:putative peptide zinc metalloprotease protein